jgi:hypothetical protein
MVKLRNKAGSIESTIPTLFIREFFCPFADGPFLGKECL